MMITKSVWDEFLYSEYYYEGKKVKETSYVHVFTCLFFSMATILLDLILLPLELMAFIIYKFIEKR